MENLMYSICSVSYFYNKDSKLKENSLWYIRYFGITIMPLKVGLYILPIKMPLPYICRVKSSYPEEAGYVDKRKAELDKMWKDLKVLMCIIFT